MTFSDRRPGQPLRSLVVRRLAAASFGALLVAEAVLVGLPGSVPAAIAAGPQSAHASAAKLGPDRGAGALAGNPGTEPTIQYEDALAHADDRIDFAPGDRVSVPFRPRATDGWAVNGRRPSALPAGRASGRQMNATPQGATWAPTGSADAADGATGGASDATGPATPAPAPLAPDQPIDAGATIDAVQSSAVLPTGPDAGVPAAVAGLRRQVFGFLPYWEVNNSTTTLNYSLLSTIAYFSVGADSSGNLLKKNTDGTTTTGWAGWTSSKMTSVINNAHAAGTRVVLTLSVFAWSSGEASRQAAILGSSTARLRLAQQTAAAVRDRGADGVNLDFEPIVSGYGDEFVAFVRTLRSELSKINAGYQLTFDTTGYIGNYQIANLTAAGAADAAFIMGYDYRTAGSSYAGSIAPLGGPAYDITETVKAFLAQIPASKIILGVPYYGRAWSTTSSSLDAKTQSGAKYGYSTAVNYENAVSFLSTYGRRYDSIEQVAWTAYTKQNCTTTYGCVTTWRELYLDDPQALGAKYDLVNRYNLRGAGMWALGYDGTRTELWKTLNDKFLRDTTLPEAGISTLAQSVGDEGFVVAWTGRDDVGVTAYDVQVSTDGGAWTAWRTSTTATSDVWLGRDGHTYAFRVRARDTSGNWSPWNVTATGTGTPALARGSFGTVVVDGLSVRSAPDTSATKLATASVGEVYAITGGPVSADGYTWYEVMGPISSWGPTGDTPVGAWVAATNGTDTYVAARRAPNATVVDAGITGLAVSAGGSGLLTADGGSTSRTFTPNGNGILDTLDVSWTNETTLDSLALNVYRSDGSRVGSRPLSALSAGQKSFAWDGTVNGTRVPDGTYLLQVVGTRSGTTYTAPSARPVTASQLGAYGVTVDSVDMARFAGADRYATAAAISARSYAAGVPVAYVANGVTLADALAGGPAAAKAGGPVLPVTATTIPSAIAAELDRLNPAKIVVLGSSAVVSDAVLSNLHAFTAGTVTRLAGPDRYATAAAISRASYAPGVPVAYVANGLTFADALAGGPAAAKAGGPVLPVTLHTIPSPILTELGRLKPARIVVLGSSAVVSDGVLSYLRGYAGTVSRISGSDRYATAAAISASSYAPGVPVVYLANGLTFADALAAVPAAAKAGGPVLPVPADTIPSAIQAELARLNPARIVIVGSTSVVSTTDATIAHDAAKK